MAVAALQFCATVAHTRTLLSLVLQSFKKGFPAMLNATGGVGLWVYPTGYKAGLDCGREHVTLLRRCFGLCRSLLGCTEAAPGGFCYDNKVPSFHVDGASK